MKILQPLSNLSIQELLKGLINRSVLWFGGGFFSALLLALGTKTEAHAIYAGILIVLLFVLLIAESMIIRKRIIPEVLRRCQEEKNKPK
jgi:hypothetical protein